ncbi:hypothetical protein BYT27DRAFT_7214886 [Phlegmacium glaucopus]|nr:hypothetical protein BYT27DRAFT_7214886 [Phlegmacium glaucopus]
MESIEGKGDSTGALEDSWWSENFPQPSNYRSLPETSKWVCRLERASADGPICLKVSTAGQSRFYPAFYTSIFMLLDLHHLSSLAEVIRLPAGASEVPRHMKNIHFLDQMRLKILSGACDLGDPKDDPFVKRWVLRLIHGIPNSKMLREREPAIAAQVEKRYGLTPLLPKMPIYPKLALYEWTADHEAVLAEAARRVFTYVLFDHIRARDRTDAPHAARRWIEGLILQMKADGFESPEDPIKMATKPKRGRPKKEITTQTPEPEDGGKIQTRSQSKSTGAMDAISSLFQKAPLTISPKKRPQNVKGNRLAANAKMGASNAIRKSGTVGLTLSAAPHPDMTHQSQAHIRDTSPQAPEAGKSGNSNLPDEEGGGTASQKKRKTSEIIQPPPNRPQLLKGKKAAVTDSTPSYSRPEPRCPRWAKNSSTNMPGLISVIKLVSFDKGLFHKIITEGGHLSDANRGSTRPMPSGGNQFIHSCL